MINNCCTFYTPAVTNISIKSTATCKEAAVMHHHTSLCSGFGDITAEVLWVQPGASENAVCEMFSSNRPLKTNGVQFNSVQFNQGKNIQLF